MSINYILELYSNPEIKEKFIEDIKKIQNLEEFLNAYHTIGNFTLVPAYFNPYRAGGKTKDYWDKSLKLLRQKEESWTYKNHEIEWDEKNFIRYVNLFFLWDYLDQDGEILEIYESDNLLSYFEKVPRFIYRRGIFICAMLKVNELSTEYYAEMQNKIFNSCEAIGGYREVFEKIEKLECYKFVKEIFDSDEVKSLL